MTELFLDTGAKHPTKHVGDPKQGLIATLTVIEPQNLRDNSPRTYRSEELSITIVVATLTSLKYNRVDTTVL